MNEKQATEPHVAMWENPRFRNWIAVGRACHLVQQEMARRLKDLDLKTPHLDIMVNLARTEGISQQELARKLLVGRSNMTMLLPQMEARGIIERKPDPADKRVLRLHLTAEGRALADRAFEIQGAIIDDIMSLSSPEDCERVGDAMRLIVRHLLEQRDEETETG